MIKVRRSEDRGKANFGWLNAKHSFSFGQYYDPENMGFRDLRVINQDIIEADSGFGTHPHKDMEIITYIIDGVIEHKDSIGNVGQIKKGQIQRMSAGSGIRHSEYNPSKSEQTHLLQIWIETEKKGIDPDYEDVDFGDHKGAKLLVSKEGGDSKAKINQDFKMYGVNLNAGTEEKIEIGKNRHAWVQIVHGEVEIGGETLKPGDGAAISELPTLAFKANKDSEFIVMDLK